MTVSRPSRVDVRSAPEGVRAGGPGAGRGAPLAAAWLVAALLVALVSGCGADGASTGRAVQRAVAGAGESTETLDLARTVGGPDAETVVVLCPYEPADVASEQVGVDLTRWAHPDDDTAAALVALAGEEVVAAVDLPTSAVDACSALRSGQGATVVPAGTTVGVVADDPGGAEWRLTRS